MQPDVRIHHGYHLIDTEAWVTQRVSQPIEDLTDELREFIRHQVFRDHNAPIDDTCRIMLWCAARGWTVGEGSPVYHDDSRMARPVTIVLAAPRCSDNPLSDNASTSPAAPVAIVSVDNDPPVVYADLTTDDAYWHQTTTVDIVCPAGHRLTWCEQDLIDHQGFATTITAVFGSEPHQPLRACRDCAADERRDGDPTCECGGVSAVYCPVCDARCELRLPAVATHEPIPATTVTPVGVRRAFTESELDAIAATITRATDTAGVVHATISGIYNTLLREQRLTLSNIEPAERLNSSAFAIPTSQWQAIALAATNRADEWGTAISVSTSLVNLMPSSYDDPTIPAPTWRLPDRRSAVHTLRMTRQATDVITACTQRLAALAEHYGTACDFYQDAASSWYTHLARLFNMTSGAQTTIAADGPLSLMVSTSGGLVYAVIFHGIRRRCEVTGCDITIHDDATTVPERSASGGADHVHQPSYPLGAPQPGQWLSHS